MTSRASARRRARALFVLFGLVIGGAAAALLGPAPAVAAPVDCTANAAGVKTWVGPAAGTFDNLAHWSPAGIPQTTDTVCADAGTSIVLSSSKTVAGAALGGTIRIAAGGILTVDNATPLLFSTIENLDIDAGGVLGGSMPVSLSGSGIVIGGQVRGSGLKTVVAGASALAQTPHLGSAADRAHLRNEGTLAWTAGTFTIGGAGTTFANAGTLLVQTTGSVASVAGPVAPAGMFTNESGGTVTKSVAGTTTISVPFDNLAGGVVDVTAGTLALAGNSSSGAADGGSWSVASGGLVELTAGTRRTAGGTYSGAGIFKLNGATWVFDTAGTTVPNFTIAGGRQEGSVTPTSSFVWSGGVLGGAGTTTIPAGVSVSVDGPFVTDGHVLHNLGSFTWGTASLTLCHGAEFRNAGSFVVAGTSTFSAGACTGSAPAPKFTNLPGATFTRNIGTSTIGIGLPFENDGSAHVQTGGLSFTGGTPAGRADSGTFTAATGTSLGISGRHFDGGFLGQTPAAGTVRLTGGTITGTPQIRSATIAGGVVSYPGEATVVAGGTLSLEGATIAGKLVNHGTTTWPNSANVLLCANAVLENAATFNVLDTSGYTISSTGTCADGTGRIVNRSGATLTKTSTGTTTLTAVLENHGTVSAAAGTFGVTGNTPVGTVDDGSYKALAGATMQVGGDRTFAEAQFGELPAAGTVRTAAGAVLRGTPRFHTFAWPTGEIRGTATVIPGGSLSLDNAVLHGTIVNQGTTTWNGGTNFALCGEALFENRGAFTVLDTGNYAISNSCANTSARFLNTATGTISKPTGGTSNITGRFDNLGTVVATNGILAISGSNGVGSGGDTGSYGGTGSGTVSFLSGTRAFAGGTLGGTGVTRLAGGTFTGTPQISKLTWASGTFAAGSEATVLAGGTLDFSGVLLHGRIRNLGTMAWDGLANADLCTGAEIVNAGAFTVGGASNYGVQHSPLGACLGPAPTMTNTGTITKNTGAGNSDIKIPMNNHGTVSVVSGLLSLTAPTIAGTAGDTGSFAISPGQTLRLSGARTHTGGASYAGGGTVSMLAGAAMNGTPLVNTRLDFSGGSFGADGLTTIGASGTFNWLNGVLDGGHVHSFGTTNWTEAQHITLRNNATFVNDGLFNAAAGNGYAINDSTPSGGTLARFTNGADGIFRRTISGLAPVHVPFQNDGAVLVESGEVRFSTAGRLLNLHAGTLSGGSWTAGTNLAGGTIGVPGPVAVNAATISLPNAGSNITNSVASNVNALSGLSNVTADGSLILARPFAVANAFANAGSLRVQAGTFEVTGATFTNAGGTTSADQGATVKAPSIVLDGGRLIGKGSYVGPVTGSGGVDPGIEPTVDAAQLTITGSYANAGSLAAEIRGLTPGSGHDHLAVSGAATLDGALVLQTLGFDPALGDTVTVLTAGSLTGQFDTISGGDLPGDRYYDVSYTATSVVLTVKPVPTLTLSSETVVEPGTGTSEVVHTVTQSAASNSRTVSFDLDVVVGGNAARDEDFTAAASSVTIPPGSTSATFSVQVLADALDEHDETYTVEFADVQMAILVSHAATGTIQDDPNDLPPTVQIESAAVSYAEGDTGTSGGTTQIRLSGPSGKEISVPFVTATGTAGPNDFAAIPDGTATFLPGEVSEDVTIAVVGDTKDEFDEMFAIDMLEPEHATLAPSPAPTSLVVTITDDDDPPVVSITPTSDATEPDEATAVATFTVTLSGPSGKPVDVTYALAPGTTNPASTPADWDGASPGTLSFPEDTVSRSIDVTIKADALDEFAETVGATLTSPTNATLGTGVGVLTIEDDALDLPPTISIHDAITSESSDVTLTVQLTGPSGKPVSATATTSDGTASSADYSFLSQRLEFAPGSTTRGFTLATHDDAIDEFEETFHVTLSSPTNGTLAAGAVGTATIVDDDAEPSIAVGDLTVAEPGSGTADGAVLVTLIGATEKMVQAAVAVTAGTASSSDFATTSTPAAVTFAVGETSKRVDVAVVEDALDEDSETFTVTASAPVNAVIGDALGIVTITDDELDLPPTVSISDAAFAETDAGSSSADVTVTLSEPSGRSTSVAYATADGTAGSDDYPSDSGILEFAAGATQRTVSVGATGDLLHENDETYTVQLSSPVHLIVGDGSGTVTIRNDDQAGLSIGDAHVGEGHTGTSTATLTVSLDQAAPQAVTADYVVTLQGAGVADVDTTGGTVSIPAGELSGSIDVIVHGDVMVEPDETFLVELTNVTVAAAADTTAVVTIVEDDFPSVSIDDVSVTEPDSGTVDATLTVTLSEAAAQAGTVTFGTADGTAVGGMGPNDDYPGVAGSVSFAAGETSKTVQVAVRGDDVIEADETFFVDLSAPSKLTVGDARGVVTILNDDFPPPSISIGDTRIQEPTALPNQNMVFTVTRSGILAEASSVTVSALTTGSAGAAGPDYAIFNPVTVHFAVDEDTKTVAVGVKPDNVSEFPETVLLKLTSPVNAVIEDDLGEGTILDTDTAGPSMVSAQDVVFDESAGVATVKVVRTGDLSEISTVYAATAYGNTAGFKKALPGIDFTSMTNVLIRFQVGETEKTFDVAITDDAIDEANEQFYVNLSLPTRTHIADSRGVVTIVDDEGPVTPGPDLFVSVADVRWIEGSIAGAAGLRDVAVTLTRRSRTGADLPAASVKIITPASSTANSSDYISLTSTTLNFPAGVASIVQNIKVRADFIPEVTERVDVSLSAPTAGMQLEDNFAQIHITDDDAGTPATFHITDGVTAEGNTGTTTMTFTITRTGETQEAVRITAATGNLTGTGFTAATAGTDYTAVAATVISFAIGETTKTFTVDITGDTTDTVDEKFAVYLTSPFKAGLADAIAVGTITNDD